MNHSAIIGFGMYLPSKRIRVEEIARHWGQDGASIAQSIGVTEKTVPGEGEDSFTMAYEAAKQAIAVGEVDPERISAIYVGSESHPYAVKSTAGMLVPALDLNPASHAADLEFACKAGTAAVQIVDSMVRCGQIQYGLAIGSDCAQAKPGDALEYTAAAGAAALLLGPASSTHALCKIDSTLSYTTDTPDFWRANDEAHPRHAGRFTGEPAYFHHVRSATERMLNKANLAVGDIDHAVFHMPNGKFPARIAKELGFNTEQLEQGFIVPHIGNTYSACSLLGLVNVLQHAKKGQTILLVSYGSGAGCDAFLMTMLWDGVVLPVDGREVEYLNYSHLMQSGVSGKR